jgi:hypothetical protein
MNNYLVFDKMERLYRTKEIKPTPKPCISKPELPKGPQVRERHGTHCWWCVHPFHTGDTYHMPFKYDNLRDRFTTTGEFCSWECMKAYAIYLSTARAGEIQSFIALMRLKVFGKYVPLKAAPKRQALKIFGGPLSIEEFRKTSTQSVPIYLPYESYIIPLAETVKVDQPAEVGETLKLKRTKPLQRTASKLESALGITRGTK